MKKWFVKNNMMITIILIISLIIFDYINLPSLLGLNMSNINWNFCMGILNIVVVIMLYVITYKKLDKRTIEREKNKKEISILLINECYQQCIKHVELLSEETIEKYIVPKIDFNSTDNKLIRNLADSPFVNENIIMDLVKDGQIAKQRIEKYFEIKGAFSQYITMRITFFDKSDYYEPIKKQLFHKINIEIRNLT
ncbi:conserved hypothetical protein [Clostridium neonatale]|uniref:hypothetical protein n=1 Tax=Clostridium neonatale TaxID=137838 RepID=UPI00291B83A6|nr:hypothetical protein [Clostridium neonatale]CAI3671915.1 conserved hypothetical protein [Clostridium neonatale]